MHTLYVQGISHWTVLYELALKDRNMQVKSCLKVVLECWDDKFLIYILGFQKSNICWPPQNSCQFIVRYPVVISHRYRRTFDLLILQSASPHRLVQRNNLKCIFDFLNICPFSPRHPLEFNKQKLLYLQSFLQTA